MEKENKKIGLGSISLLLCIFGILFFIFGDSIVRFIGLDPWSNGDEGLHYTAFYSLIFYIPALIMGYKFKNDFGAKLGRTLSLIAIIFTLLSLFFFV